MIVKRGIKTSEFWVGLIGLLLPYLNQQFDLNIPTEQLVAIVAWALGYGGLRTYLKVRANGTAVGE